MFDKQYSSLFLNDLEDILENVPGLNSISNDLDNKLDIFMKFIRYLQTFLDKFNYIVTLGNVVKTKIVVQSNLL